MRTATFLCACRLANILHVAVETAALVSIAAQEITACMAYFETYTRDQTRSFPSSTIALYCLKSDKIAYTDQQLPNDGDRDGHDGIHNGC
jgi:hypothetical protein